MKRLRVTAAMKKQLGSTKERKEVGVFLLPKTVIIDKKRDPVTGEVQMWNGRPILQGRRQTVDEWEAQYNPEAQQALLMQSVRNEGDALDTPAAVAQDVPKLASPPMPPVVDTADAPEERPMTERERYARAVGEAARMGQRPPRPRGGGHRNG